MNSQRPSIESKENEWPINSKDTVQTTAIQKPYGSQNLVTEDEEEDERLWNQKVKNQKNR